MKRLFIITAIILFGVSPIYAQFGIGLKAGANFTTKSGSGLDLDGFEPDFSNKTGFHGGAYLYYFFGDNVAIQPEVIFSQKGATITDIGKSELTYIDIPILLRVHFLKILNIHAGPSINILSGAKLTGDNLDEDIKDSLKNTEWSIAFGAGVNLPLRLQLTARYIQGLTNINDSEAEGELKNRMFQLSLGFRLIGNK